MYTIHATAGVSAGKERITASDFRSCLSSATRIMNNQKGLPKMNQPIPSGECASRKAYLDWIRVIAIALVIFNHLPGYTLYENSGAGRPFYLFCTLITRINVPLLLMVSGTLLLDRNESVKKVLKYRVLRIAGALVFAYIGLFLLRSAHDVILYGIPFSFSPGELIPGILSRRLITADAGSYWYLYAYLGYLLMLPFLRKAVREMEKGHWILLLVLHGIIYTILPLVNLLLPAENRLSLSADFSVPLATTQAFFYTISGYWLDRHSNTAVTRKKDILTALLGLAVTCAAGALFLLSSSPGDGISPSFLTMFDWVAAFCAFLVIRHMTTVTLPGLSRGKHAKRIAFLSSLCFGIYLFDPWLKLVLFGLYYRAAAFLPELIRSLVWIPISMTVGGIATFVLKKIPGFRKLL